jgi:hypothetical protein
LVLRTALRFSPGPGGQKLASLKQFARLIVPFCDARLRDNGSGRVTEIVVLFGPPRWGLLEATRYAGGDSLKILGVEINYEDPRSVCPATWPRVTSEIQTMNRNSERILRSLLQGSSIREIFYIVKHRENGLPGEMIYAE